MAQMPRPYARARRTKRNTCNTPTCALVAQSAQDGRERRFHPPAPTSDFPYFPAFSDVKKAGHRAFVSLAGCTATRTRWRDAPTLHHPALMLAKKKPERDESHPDHLGQWL